MKIQFKFFLILLILSLFFSNPSKAVSTGQVLGQITEKENGNPIAFATVIFENRMDKMEVQANEYGYYYAGHLPTGKYQMRVDFNSRTFFMNKIQVFDGYSNEVNFALSTDPALPVTVELERKEPLISALTSTDINLTNSTNNQPTRTLDEALSVQPGVDVIDGRVFVKGSDQVRYFIDGTPLMGNGIVGRRW